jgi:hypothetical protein
VWNEDASVRAITLGGGLEGFLRAHGFWGFIATAPGKEKLSNGKPFDFVSRFFAPAKGVPEDPVTGSAHCALVPYWAKRLGRNDLHAFQASARGGELFCRADGARVIEFDVQAHANKVLVVAEEALGDAFRVGAERRGELEVDAANDNFGGQDFGGGENFLVFHHPI